MEQVSEILDTVTSTAAELGPVLQAAAQDPWTYTGAVGLALLVYGVRAFRAKK